MRQSKILILLGNAGRGIVLRRIGSDVNRLS